MKKKVIRINSIHIANYRGIDDLELTFPLGRMSDDPDVTVLGSMNGVGKTSVLECCAWVLLAASSGKEAFEGREFDYASLVKSGCDSATVRAKICVANKVEAVDISFHKSGVVQTSGLLAAFNGKKGHVTFRASEGIVGMYPDPVVGKSFFFLHSYRKVQEGKPELGMLVDEEMPDPVLVRRYGFRYAERMTSFSLFKKLIVRHLMEGADLFEASMLKKQEKDADAITALNGLLKTYADVKVGKLRPYRNNTIDVQVEKLDEPGRGFSIDGLSSGQKEIISTLFLIWNATYKNPSVVLIDEPELHLNLQWHSGFVRKLLELAPSNQYVLATHAEAIMASVDKRNRVLLRRDANDEREAPL